jgi:hypothetical protein
MTLQAVESLLLWIGLIGFLVSGAAYVITRLHEGLGMKLVTLARRIGSLVGVIIVLMFAAGLFGHGVTPSELFASLKNEIRDLYGQAAHLRRAPEDPDSQVPGSDSPAPDVPSHVTN